MDGSREWLRKIEARQEAQTKRFRVKLAAVEYKGGKCQVCGYSRSLRAMDFHHPSPGEKEFSISENMGAPWAVMRAELDKCYLVCANCHREIHDGLHPHLLHELDPYEDTL